MPPAPILQPASFAAFVTLVEDQQALVNRPLWFRGTGDAAKHRLLPTLYRHRIAKDALKLQALESQLMTRFRQRSIPFVARPPSDDWDLMFFMQHHGIPTRLLDWTENPFIGLFFAVMSSQFSGKFKAGEAILTYSTDAAIWILDPEIWNTHALRHQRFDRGILTSGDEAIQSYKPLTKFDDMNVHPVAMYGAYNSPRIVAQRGAFTIFGKGTGALEDAYDSDAFPAGCLTKIVLGKAILPEMRKSLLRTGITESVVFPDLDGLSKEIKRSFKFDF